MSTGQDSFGLDLGLPPKASQAWVVEELVTVVEGSEEPGSVVAVVELDEVAEQDQA